MLTITSLDSRSKHQTKTNLELILPDKKKLVPKQGLHCTARTRSNPDCGLASFNNRTGTTKSHLIYPVLRNSRDRVRNPLPPFFGPSPSSLLHLCSHILPLPCNLHTLVHLHHYAILTAPIITTSTYYFILSVASSTPPGAQTSFPALRPPITDTSERLSCARSPLAHTPPSDISPPTRNPANPQQHQLKMADAQAGSSTWSAFLKVRTPHNATNCAENKSPSITNKTKRHSQSPPSTATSPP